MSSKGKKYIDKKNGQLEFPFTAIVGTSSGAKIISLSDRKSEEKKRIFLKIINEGKSF